MEHAEVLVVGGGQAGLSVSHELTRNGVEHVVLERGRIGQSWRDRWDSFCLVTPNWSVQLPDGAYDGTDPDGFMPRDEIVAFLERYASRSRAPVTQGPLAHRSPRLSEPDRPSARPRPDRGQRPVRLPAGRGAARRWHEVVLACGKASWAPRRIGDHDVYWWAVESGFLDGTIASLPSPSARLGANILATGHGKPHDLDHRTLRAIGVTLVGHFLGADDEGARFAQDLTETVARGTRATAS